MNEHLQINSFIKCDMILPKFKEAVILQNTRKKSIIACNVRQTAHLPYIEDDYNLVLQILKATLTARIISEISVMDDFDSGMSSITQLQSTENYLKSTLYPI